MAYRADKYWEREEPRQADAGNVVIRWYVEARRLQVHSTFRGEDGERRTRNVVTLDLEALATAPAAVALLRSVLGECADIAALETPARSGTPGRRPLRP